MECFFNEKEPLKLMFVASKRDISDLNLVIFSLIVLLGAMSIWKMHVCFT